MKVKVTLVQALRLCTGRTAYRGSRSIALPFHDHGTRTGVRGQRHAPAALYLRKRPGNRCTGGGVGPRAGLDRCGKSRPHRDSILGPSSPWPVAIPTELSRLQSKLSVMILCISFNFNFISDLHTTFIISKAI